MKKVLVLLFILITSISSVAESINLECKQDDLDKTYFFSDYILTLWVNNNSPSVTTHFHAIKYNFKKKINMHMHREGAINPITVKDNSYDWNSLPEYKGDVFDSYGELTYGYLQHMKRPHINYYLNRESLKLKSSSLTGKKFYQCEIIENLAETIKFYEIEYAEVQKLNEIEKNKQLKKNKI